jgi:hypothetical protein
MEAAYRIAHELLKDRLQEKAPEMLAALEEIQEADVLVVRGQYDRIEDVFRHSGTPFTSVLGNDLNQVNLRPDQIVFVNCPGVMSEPALRSLAAFVQDGGFLFTTDWALRHVLEPAFPGYIEYNQRRTGDEVVRVEIDQSGDPFLASLIGPDDDPQWWLEASSYPIRILDSGKVSVLVRSGEIRERYGEEPVLVSFDVGSGKVYHMISHFYLQRSETRTLRHKAPSSTYLAEKGIAPELMAKYRRMGSEILDTSSVESAYTSHTITSGILIAKVRQKQHLPRTAGAGGQARRAKDDKNAAKPQG